MSDEAWEGTRDSVSGKPWLDVALGVLSVPLMHGCFAGLLWAGSLIVQTFGGLSGSSLIVVPSMFLFGISVGQLGYVIPAFLVAYRLRRNVAAGIAIGAILTVSLQGACYGAFFFMMG